MKQNKINVRLLQIVVRGDVRRDQRDHILNSGATTRFADTVPLNN